MCIRDRFTFLGGATFYFGPIIGAVLMVLAFVLFSEFTKAWLLYLGLIFLFMVMYAPGGIASLIMMNVRVAAFGKLKQLLGNYLAMAATLLMALSGAAAVSYTHLTLPTSGLVSISVVAGSLKNKKKKREKRVRCWMKK